MPLGSGATHGRAKQKRLEMEDLLSHLEVCIRKKLPPLVIMLGQGCRGEMVNMIRKEIAAIRALMKRVNPEVMQWGSTADRMRYQNLVHSFDAQMRSAELRQQDKERRRFGRINLDLPVAVRSARQNWRAQAVNLNLDGVKLRTETTHKVGETIELDIEGEFPLRKVKGKVVWSRAGQDGNHEEGIKFLALDEELKEDIRRFLIEEEVRRATCQPREPEVKAEDKREP